jgi:hypothetical protein
MAGDRKSEGKPDPIQGERTASHCKDARKYRNRLKLYSSDALPAEVEQSCRVYVIRTSICRNDRARRGARAPARLFPGFTQVADRIVLPNLQ